jgi:hypothetical protein
MVAAPKAVEEAPGLCHQALLRDDDAFLPHHCQVGITDRALCR